MPDTESLRPLETVILRLHDEGLDSVEIGKKVGKKPGTVDRILEMIDLKADLPEQKDTARADESTPIERVIERLRDEGETYGEIGNRLNKSGDRIKAIEEYRTLRPDNSG
jgi:hypothetical protein